jgi:predicted alpha/beta-fold hydrolase
MEPVVVMAPTGGDEDGGLTMMHNLRLSSVVAGAVLAYGLYYLVALVSRIDLRYDKDHPGTAALLRRCSLLKGHYWPSPWIFSGHLDALVMMRMRPTYDPQYRREEIQAEDGTTLLLDWAERSDMAPSAPVLILLSGVTGSGRSSYITYLAREGMQKGWRCVTLNYPGTLGEQLTAPRLYSVSSDVRHLVDHVASSFPSAPLFALGFSLGGFLLTKYLGEAGDKTPLRAGIICSSPWSHAQLVVHWTGWAKTYVYGKHFIKHFLKIYSNNQVFKDHTKLNHENVLSCKTLFDLHTHLHAPLSGEESIEEYYLANDTCPLFANVKIPTLVVHALNDPVVPQAALPVEEIGKNPLAILAVTRTGGHGGWCKGLWPTGLSWVELACLQYIDAHLQLGSTDSSAETCQ